MMRSEKLVTVSIDKRVALLTLNRPDVMNSLNAATTRELTQQLVALESNELVHVIVLTGAGKAFSAGVDLTALSTNDEVLSNDKPLLAAFRSCSKPIIAAVNGAAVTGGLELVLNCDFIYASEKAKFADTHMLVGLLPTWGMSQLLARRIGLNRALELSLSGRYFSAAEALEWGMVNKVVAAEELLQETMQVAQAIAANDIGVVRQMRKLIKSSEFRLLDEALTQEYAVSHGHNAMVDYREMAETLAKLRARK